MRRTLLILFLVVAFFQTAQAQKKTDTLLYFMKNSGELAANKDSADYFLFIMPLDKSAGQKLYPVNEFYPNGQPKLISNSTNRSTKINLDGSCINFFSDGRKKSITNYKNGTPVGDITEYYPNGKLYAIENYSDDKKLKLVECRDSAGNVLAENGNGRWIKFNDDVDRETGAGTVKDSLEDGEWAGNIDDTGKYTCLYSKGIIISGKGFDRSGTAYPFTKLEIEPYYKKGIEAFNAYLEDKVENDDSLKTLTTRVGVKFEFKLTVTFVVNKDGTLSKVAVIDNLTPNFLVIKEILKAVRSSTNWVAGSQYGMPANLRVIIPLKIVLYNPDDQRRLGDSPTQE